MCCIFYMNYWRQIHEHCDNWIANRVHFIGYHKTPTPLRFFDAIGGQCVGGRLHLYIAQRKPTYMIVHATRN